MYLLSFCLYKDNRAEHGLRGFMPRNRVTPYECRRHEVRGCGPPNWYRRLKDAKVTKSRLSDDCTGMVTIPRTSPLATLVGSYGATYSRSLRSCDPCFARLYMSLLSLCPKNKHIRDLLYLLSLCLKKIFYLPTPSACSHSPYIFHAENTWGEKISMCIVIKTKEHKEHVFLWVKFFCIFCPSVYIKIIVRSTGWGASCPEI